MQEPQTTTTINNTKKAGIEVFAYMMIGIPTETKDDIKKSMDLVLELKPTHVNYSICTPFPKTVLYERSLVQGSSSEDYWLQFAIKPSADFKIRTLNENISSEELRNLQDRALRSFYSSPYIILREIIKTRSLKQLYTKFKIGIRLLMPRAN